MVATAVLKNAACVGTEQAVKKGLGIVSIVAGVPAVATREWLKPPVPRSIFSTIHPTIGKFVGLDHQLNATRCPHFGKFVRNYLIYP
ncbi:MAG: hypothetical protein QOD67_3901 [Caballeronia sp.]|nr:hypothetical protein [Caballeronia sp.]